MSHLNTLVLHQLRLGELDPAKKSAAEAHLGACSRCAARAAAQHHDRARFEAAPTPPALLGLSTPANHPHRRATALASSFVAMAAALWLVALGAGAPDTPRERTRGDTPEIELWVQSSAGVRAVHPEDRLGSGDVVQLKYGTDGAGFAVVAGRDLDGEIEVYGSLPLHAQLAEAPFSLTLDDTPGVQEFFLVTGPSSFGADEARAAIRGAREDLGVAFVSVAKESP